MPKIVAISDTHHQYRKITIPECDILISAGDYSGRGEKHTVKDFHAWMNEQPAKHKISVQGNHEVWVEKNFEEAKALALSMCPGLHFIDEGLVDIDGLKIYGSAITPWFHDWAWNRRIDDIKVHWDKIPEDAEILVTHGPAYGILDEVGFHRRAGCAHLLDRIAELEKLKIHICGHIHDGHGFKIVNNKHHFNVAICDDMYMPSYEPTIIEV